MNKHWKIGTLLLVTLCASVLLFGQTQQSKPQHPLGQEPDISEFPIADFETEKDRKDKDKGRKYNLRNAPPISEASDLIFAVSHSELYLPLFPVALSSAIVIGEITDATAHLSEDHTNIYSEFSFRISKVLKHDNDVHLSGASSIAVERVGGRIRLPSGKVVVSRTSRQDMPRVGRHYVLFLTHNSLGGRHEGFYIVTGYEFRNGRVFPLDPLGVAHPSAKYFDTSESEFLNDLVKALDKPSSISEPR